MRRGEVWWANLHPPAGRRPVLLVSRDSTYGRRELVMIAPISTRIRHIRGEVLLGPADGLPRPCAANLDTLDSISKSQLDEPIGLLSEERLRAVNQALLYALGL